MSEIQSKEKNSIPIEIPEKELLALEAQYCSHGDTVHYNDPPKVFTRCEGSFMYDESGQAFLDLQMWYSAVNFVVKVKDLVE